ncbi:MULTISPECIES: DUF2577 domain-containing protein [Lacrimispora]|uniref:DUF2577 domain-containing protein n=1 Tax=Lacrimispora TaxID=2719231 RepID=UPI000BE35B35|nr:DUF2577 domain-containing protein [Lacrimispora amygdalina]MDK2966917.1 hypothetical protein [Lacrimispora sp.]
MADTIWVDNIKKIVFQAMEAADPCDVIAGTVVKEHPVEIQISQKTILNQNQILLTEQFLEHREIMDIPGVGEVAVTVKNTLKSGDHVLLIQKKGGQQFVAIGKW